MGAARALDGEAQSMSAPVILSQVTGDSARARRSDRRTSHAAADSISARSRVASAAEVALILASSVAPLAAFEIADIHDGRFAARATPRRWSHSRLRTALHELSEQGVVEEAGETATPSGRRALTWRLREQR